MRGALVLLALAGAAAASVSELARRDPGDVFTLTDVPCGAAQCAEHGARADAADACACSCPHRAPLFREDRELCVDDLPECSLASFGTGVGVQRIPFVYLPLKGQIIHPSKDITFTGVKTPICAVSGAQFLTPKGFVDLRNTLDADVPFSLFRDEGRTFLQWSGEDDVRARMSGRMMVVRLLCRDVAATPASPLDLRGVFTPCVAFRVQGTPPKPMSNVTEVQFAPNAQTSQATTTSGLSVTEYVAIGISSLLLGLIYVASVFLYLHIRKRRKVGSEDSSRRLKSLKNKDGSIITERDIVRINNDRVQSLPPSLDLDDGIIKNNPLMGMSRQFHQIKHSFPSDSGSTLSDSEDFADSSVRSEDHMYKDQTTSALIHSHHSELKLRNSCSDLSHRDESGIERLPDEHVSIVETTDDREIARPVGTTRRKLYFNPAYFEPHLMAEPPPAALEFLTKIREVIAVAKHKMAAKRFHPVLNEIPEEETYPSRGNSLDIYQAMGSQRSGSVVSLKRENSRKRSLNCVGCPGCKTETSSEIHNFIKYDVPACSNCLSTKGEKQNSIRKWLEDIPTGKQSFYNEFQPTNQNGLVNSLLSLPSSENQCKLKKQNSFCAANTMNLTENFTKKRKTSTLSVRSEPPLRSYNLPLPEFDKITHNNNRNYYGQTISRTDDIRPIGLYDHRSGSLRNNVITNQHRNKLITNKNSLPDMVNEAIAIDHCTQSYNQNSSDEEKFNNKINNTTARKTSESPPVNDYETDSLERTSTKKGLSTPPEYPEIPSSQASPSLSNALPLEEELTMTNAVYKTQSSSNSNTPSPQRDICMEQNHYETIEKKQNLNNDNKTVTTKNSSDNSYSLVSEVYVNNNYNFGSTPTSPSGSECSMGSRKLRGTLKNSEEKPGCLTIEVKDPPENYIKIHESDGFEPDTLDRKNSKQKEIVENIQFSRKDLIKNIDSNGSPMNHRIQLRSSGTFKKADADHSASKFCSLRYDYETRKNIYERPKLLSTTFNDSKSLEDTTEPWEDAAPEWSTEEGRILTLELRHSKRQRQCTPPTIKQMKNLARPDILPPLPPTNDHPLYEQPSFPPRRVESAMLPLESHPKNLNGRSLSPRTFTKNTTTDQISNKNFNVRKSDIGHSCSPTRASVQSQFSDYENIHPIDTNKDVTRNTDDYSRISSRRRVDRRHSSSTINTNTFVKESKDVPGKSFRMKRKKGSQVDDSGYLSSDSAGSRRIQRKLVVAKIVSCSESDDTENEARSESGAESIETHSVYFGSYRKPQINVENDVKMFTYDKSERNCGRRSNF